MAVNILDYSIPGTIMWEPPCYYWTLSGPKSSHSPSCGTRWALTLQGNVSRPDLRDQPILDPDLVLYTNGTSLVKQGRLSGYAVVMEETVTEARPLPSHWSAQGAKLYALISALHLSRVKKTNIYPDSKYTFATLYVHRALYRRETFWKLVKRYQKRN